MRVDSRNYARARRSGGARAITAIPLGAGTVNAALQVGTARVADGVRGTVGRKRTAVCNYGDGLWIKIPRVNAVAFNRFIIFRDTKNGTGSDGDNTFAFFDDFDAAISATKWSNNGTNPAVSGSEVLFDDYGTTNDESIITNLTFDPTAYVARSRQRPISVSGDARLIFGFSNTVNITGSSDNCCAYYGLDRLYPAYGSVADYNAQAYDLATYYSHWHYFTPTTYYSVVGVGTNTRTATISKSSSWDQFAMGGTWQNSAVDAVAIYPRFTTDPKVGTYALAAANRALCKGLQKADLLRAICN